MANISNCTHGKHLDIKEKKHPLIKSTINAIFCLNYEQALWLELFRLRNQAEMIASFFWGEEKVIISTNPSLD